jgi:hypothetical protein
VSTSAYVSYTSYLRSGRSNAPAVTGRASQAEQHEGHNHWSSAESNLDARGCRNLQTANGNAALSRFLLKNSSKFLGMFGDQNVKCLIDRDTIYMVRYSSSSLSIIAGSGVIPIFARYSSDQNLF